MARSCRTRSGCFALAAAYVGRKVRLVCDNGRFHYTKAVQQWLAAHREQIEIYWLPPYCPSLNLIERLWGHLKRTVLANVLFQTMDDLVAAFNRGVGRVNGHRDRMGFMFDHDDVQQKKAAWNILRSCLEKCSPRWTAFPLVPAHISASRW